MNFAPFAYRQGIVSAAPPSPFPSGLTVNLWQGNYTAGSTSWTNDAPGSTAVVSAIPIGGYTKNATGVVFSGTTRSILFQINSDGVWDSTTAYTIISYMHVTSTTNKTFWGKQSTNSNGMGVDFTNNPLIIMRAPGSGQQIFTTSNTTRGSLKSYAFTSTGNTNGQYYLDSSSVATTVNTTTTNFWNNTRNFTFGYSFQWTDPSIQCFLNRLLIFNRALSGAEISSVYTYINANQ
jgi:hypothetical protein